MVKRKSRKRNSCRSPSKHSSSRERLVQFRQNHLLPVFLLVVSLAFVVCIVAVTWEGPGITSAVVVNPEEAGAEITEVDGLSATEEFFSKAKQYWKWSIPLEVAALFTVLLLFYGRKMARLPVSRMPPRKKYKRSRR